MTSTKRKPAKRGKKKPRANKQAPSRMPSPAAVAEVSVQRGFIEVATIGAQSLVWLATLVAGAAVLAGVGFALWSLRPVPAYSSDRVTIGSAFQVTFRIENTSAWFALTHLAIRCVVEGVDAPGMPPVEADSSRIPARLGPGEQATFTCPFPAADPEIAQRSELYFRSKYDMPGVGAVKLRDTRGPFVINTHLLPPRWTPKPGKD
ncbi:MAG TPA: hypothetical protein VFB13_12170 [Reyranella sp.]|jgi:hypothetical protein|nr:hypothetical protein [Reyranella sp.]